MSRKVCIVNIHELELNNLEEIFVDRKPIILRAKVTQGKMYFYPMNRVADEFGFQPTFFLLDSLVYHATVAEVSLSGHFCDEKGRTTGDHQIFTGNYNFRTGHGALLST